MSSTTLALAAATALVVSITCADALPLLPAPAPASSQLITTVAGGCGPGLTRGRLGTCVARRAIFSRGRIVRKGCGKPIGAGLRTPC